MLSLCCLAPLSPKAAKPTFDFTLPVKHKKLKKKLFLYLPKVKLPEPRCPLRPLVEVHMSKDTQM